LRQWQHGESLARLVSSGPTDPTIHFSRTRNLPSESREGVPAFHQLVVSRQLYMLLLLHCSIANVVLVRVVQRLLAFQLLHTERNNNSQEWLSCKVRVFDTHFIVVWELDTRRAGITEREPHQQREDVERLSAE